MTLSLFYSFGDMILSSSFDDIVLLFYIDDIIMSSCCDDVISFADDISYLVIYLNICQINY